MRRVTALSCLRPSFSPHTPVPVCPIMYSLVLCLAAAFCSGVTYSSSTLPERSIVENTNLSPERLLGQPCFLPIAACHSHLRCLCSVLLSLHLTPAQSESPRWNPGCRLSLLSHFFCPPLLYWDLPVVTGRKEASFTGSRPDKGERGDVRCRNSLCGM